MAKAHFFAAAVVVGMLNNTPLATAINNGGAATIDFYNGTPPADADAAESNTKLATLTCANPAFSGVAMSGSNARATFAPISSGTAVASGTATHFRIKNGAGTVIDQGTVDTSNADIVMSTTAFSSGSTISLTSATIDLPKG